MRENDEDWPTQLDTIIVELVGLFKLAENDSEKALQLLSKLKGLSENETQFSIYRKTVFECISLLREIQL